MGKRERTIFARGMSAIADRGRCAYEYVGSARSRYGYVRLPTDGLDESTSKVISEEVCPLLLFNGIIYSIDYLCERFGLTHAASRSDHELLKQGLARHGVDFLSHCRGMFAIAYCTAESVVLARDTIGIKPLYFVYEDGVFAFASEIKALLPFGSSQVHEVKPGEVITFDRTTFLLSKKKFSYRALKKVPHDDHAVEHLEALLYRSVVAPTRRYLAQSAKSVGLLVSGGLDSSILCALLHKHLTTSELQRVQYFCIGSEDSTDRAHAEHVADHYQIDINITDLQSDHASIKDVDRMTHLVESPYARVVRVALLQDELARRISDAGIDVVISGEGADELFFGYAKFIYGLTSEQVEKVYESFFSQMFHRTLLQRLDRVFARRCIEGRVPFLDQAFVAYAQRLGVHHKIQKVGDELVTKVVLRKLAQHLWRTGTHCAAKKDYYDTGSYHLRKQRAYNRISRRSRAVAHRSRLGAVCERPVPSPLWPAGQRYSGGRRERYSEAGTCYGRTLQTTE